MSCACRRSKVASKDAEFQAEKKVTVIEDDDGKKNFQAWTSDDTEEEEEEDHCSEQYTWKDIALMMDKITMYVYLVLVTGFTIVSMAVMMNHYYRWY